MKEEVSSWLKPFLQAIIDLSQRLGISLYQITADDLSKYFTDHDMPISSRTAYRYLNTAIENGWITEHHNTVKSYVMVSSDKYIHSPPDIYVIDESNHEVEPQNLPRMFTTLKGEKRLMFYRLTAEANQLLEDDKNAE